MASEPTVTSLQSVTEQEKSIVEINAWLRWWMRHHHHIGLASLAGSALLVCIIAVVLLPIVVHNSIEGEQCSITATATNDPIASTISTVGSTVVIENPIPSDPLCAANAIWKSQAVTVAGSSDGASSLTRSHLKDPNDVFINIDGHLLVADSGNNRVMCWPINATEGFMVAGTGVRGSWSNLLKYPAAIFVWNNRLYVSDLDNCRILVFQHSVVEGSPDGFTIVGRHGAGSALNQINGIYYMSIDVQRGVLLMSDSGNNRILRVDLKNNAIQLLAGSGTNGSDSASLNYPLGIDIYKNTGSIYVADSRNHRIQQFVLNSTQGITVAGGFSLGENLSQLYSPSGVTVDAHGNVYVADSGNHRIVQWLVGAQQGRVIAGSGIAGISNTQLNYPVQLKFDIHNNLYVVDKNNNRIQRFDLQSNGC